MEEIIQVESRPEIETLESEVKEFADRLDYWAKYLAEKILSGNIISDDDIDTAYSYLLEQLTLNPSTEKPEIIINYGRSSSRDYKLDLLFTKLENVEGVNALSEKHPIEFCPCLTIIFGATGAGKTGYVRLMKQVFYSKVPEEIIRNIYLEKGHKPVSGKFTFQSAGSDITLKYPDNISDSAFQQFAVFDDKSVAQHLDHRNEFEFRPTGLSFFASFTESFKRVESRLNAEIIGKPAADIWKGICTATNTLTKNLSWKI